MTTSTFAPHRAACTATDPATATGGTTRHGLLVGLLTRPGAAPAALVRLPDGRRAVTSALREPQVRRVEAAVADRLRPPTTRTGRQLVRWLERPLPAELRLCGPGPADVVLTAVAEPASRVELGRAGAV